MKVTVYNNPEKSENTIVKLSHFEFVKWNTAFINTLPDSAFAYISPGGKKDGEGKTIPRTLRHLPYKNAGGQVDLPHLRNALARLSQTNIPQAAKASVLSKLRAAAKNAGVKTKEE